MENANKEHEVSLYQALKATGLEITNHESDLYIHVTPETTAILDRYPLQKKNSSAFTSPVDKKRTYDIPFAYEPFWEAKLKNEPTKSTEGDGVKSGAPRFK